MKGVLRESRSGVVLCVCCARAKGEEEGSGEEKKRSEGRREEFKSRLGNSGTATAQR
jgi:hypothetical protein